ncbi:uncharacterized protein STEHIDRAFT_151686 [Stereum hirsutum FP-91666 SS1]|uniref:uncharacterized protein n=1 Tax=Stereum hirsutum (strain FP-91666) TaxID=721885 RepID=UPI000440BDA5|nr:uncharacterized protein STEHIDRAFT_151686 [Stereum hirsutum FP-91666 SS1]EIM92355.1 hypothetical protein STEHIDRAFT_151686 [Stereum hirsutum FP-91666 SS1]
MDPHPTIFTNQLNNYLQSRNEGHLLSWIELMTGPAHAPTWTVQCKFDGELISTGHGAHKHEAKGSASKQALEILRQRG